MSVMIESVLELDPDCALQSFQGEKPIFSWGSLTFKGHSWKALTHSVKSNWQFWEHSALSTGLPLGLAEDASILKCV